MKCSRTVHMNDMLLLKAKCERKVLICVADTGNYFFNVQYFTLNHTQLCFVLTGPWQGDMWCKLAVVLFGKQLLCVGLPIVEPWRVSHLLDRGRLNSMPVKSASLLLLIHILSEPSLQEWSCSSFFNLSTDIRVVPLDPPTQLLIGSYWSFSSDPFTLLLEVGDMW